MFAGFVTLLRRTAPRGGGPKLFRKLCRPPLSTSPVLLTTSRRQPLRSRVIQSDPDQSRVKTLLDNQHPMRLPRFRGHVVVLNMKALINERTQVRATLRRPI